MPWSNEGIDYTYLRDRSVRFPRYPRMVEDLDQYELPEGLGVQLRGAATPVLLRGRHALRVFAYLSAKMDGSQTLEGLYNGRPPDLPGRVLLKALRLLHVKGLVVGGNEARPGPAVPEGFVDGVTCRQLLFWGRNLGSTAYHHSAVEVRDVLASSQVALIATGLLGVCTFDLVVRSGCGNLSVTDWDDDGLLRESLRGSLVTPVRYAHSGGMDEVVTNLRDWLSFSDLVVVATRNAPSSLLLRVNRLCLRREVPLLLCNESSGRFEIGPLVLPYRSACYRCLQLRRESVTTFPIDHMLYELHLAVPRPTGRGLPHGEWLPAATWVASSLSAEVVRWLTKIAAPQLVDHVLQYSPLSGSQEMHRVLRVPRCPDCQPGSRLPLAKVADRD
jgi:bacteriocin biosynthesis cyclodehydratase domain-containing protein